MEFRKNIIATGKEMNDAFDKGFSTNKVRIKFVEALELKGKQKYLSDNETYTFNTLFRASEDFKVPKKKTMTMKDFKGYLNKLDNNKNMEDKKMSEKHENMSYEDMRNLIGKIGNANYENFVKAVVSFEKNIDDVNVLDKVYTEFMNNDTTGLIHEDFHDIITECIKSDIIERDELDETQDMDIDDEKEDNTKNINGYVATDIEIKTLINRDGEKFKVANFSIAENDDMGGVNYTNCTAYNDKIDKVKDFKKGDFVHLFGKEKISYGKDDKEYVNLSILSAKMLKEKTVYKIADEVKNIKKSKSVSRDKTAKKKISVKGKLKKYKEKADKTVKKSLKKTKGNER